MRRVIRGYSRRETRHSKPKGANLEIEKRQTPPRPSRRVDLINNSLRNNFMPRYTPSLTRNFTRTSREIPPSPDAFADATFRAIFPPTAAGEAGSSTENFRLIAVSYRFVWDDVIGTKGREYELARRRIASVLNRFQIL